MDGLKRFFHKTLASEFWEIGNDLKKDPWPLLMSWPRTATHLQRFWRLLKNQAISSTGRGFPFLFWCYNLKYISISISDLLQIQNSLATCKGTKTARSASCRVFRLCLWTLVWPVFSMITGARCLDVGPGHLQYHDNAFSAPSRCLQFPGVQICMKIRTNPCKLMDMMDIIVVFKGLLVMARIFSGLQFDVASLGNIHRGQGKTLFFPSRGVRIPRFFRRCPKNSAITMITSWSPIAGVIPSSEKHALLSELRLQCMHRIT